MAIESDIFHLFLVMKTVSFYHRRFHLCTLVISFA